MVLVGGPSAETVAFVETGVSGDDKWEFIAECSGKLYCPPFSASGMLVINPQTDTTRVIETGVEGILKWRGIVAGA